MLTNGELILSIEDMDKRPNMNTDDGAPLAVVGILLGMLSLTFLISAFV